MDLWSVFDFLLPGLLGSEKQFHSEYRKPVQASRSKRADAQDLSGARVALSRLHSVCLPFVLRRLKQDVMPELPPKIIQDIMVDMQPP